MNRLSLINSVEKGELPLAQANEYAQSYGFGDLEIFPSKVDYDPFNLDFWELSQALIWIATQDLDKIIVNSSNFRFNTKKFQPTDNPIRPYKFGPAEPVTRYELSKYIADIDQVFETLKLQAIAGKILTFASIDNNDKIEVGTDVWKVLKLSSRQDKLFCVEDNHLISTLSYSVGLIVTNMEVERKSLLNCFPAELSVQFKPLKTVEAIDQALIEYQNKIGGKIGGDNAFQALSKIDPSVNRDLVRKRVTAMQGPTSRGRPKK
jgi:hypothetical protein